MNKVKRIAALTAVVILLAWHKSKFYWDTEIEPYPFEPFGLQQETP